MKKLMIAAAVAAMIGGANAQLVYDFCASMKTTTAKADTQTTTYSYNFGFGYDGNTSAPRVYWYEDPCFTQNGQYLDWSDGTYYVSKLVKMDSKSGKGTIQSSLWNKMSQTAKEAFVTSLAAYGDYYDPQNPTKSVTDPSYFNRAPTFTGVKDDYRGKDNWCLTVKWTQKIEDTACYRVAGSVKLVARYDVSDCCDPTITWDPDFSYTKTEPSWIADPDYCITINPVLNYRFGALTLEKATKAELVAEICDRNDSTKLPRLMIAGQGSVAQVKNKNGVSLGYQICSISGNIAGVWVDPVCEVCCGNSPDAMVFDCANDPSLWDGMGQLGGRASNDIKTKGDPNVVEPIWAYGWIDSRSNLWGTAAYGTFTLKYNQKESL